MLHRFKGCLLAGACGDALGYPVEFYSNTHIKAAYGKSGITEMKLSDGKALVSDDTQMSVYTTQGLIHAKKANCDYWGTVMEVYKSYLRWSRWQFKMPKKSVEKVYSVEDLLNDDLIADGKNQELKDNRAPGNTCLSSLESGKYGTRENLINDSKGCGAVMRVAPIAIAFVKDSSVAYNLATDTSLLTHDHVLGYTTSGALVLILIKIFNGLSIEEAVSVTIEELRIKSECETLIPVLEQAVKTAKDGVTASKAFFTLGKGWVGEEALAIAIWAALLYPHDLKQAIVAAVNHSGDSDSTGAICGYIVGSSLGVEAIPSSWLENLELKDLICDQIDEICRLFNIWLVCCYPQFPLFE